MVVFNRFTNYKSKVFLGLLIAFNAYCMKDKFEWDSLPLELQTKIVLDKLIGISIENSRFVSPGQFYNNFLRLRKKSKAFWQLIKKALKNQNLCNLYFPNKILNKKFPKWLLTKALIYAIRGNSLEVTELLVLMGANAKVWDVKTKRPIIDSVTNEEIKQLLLNYSAIENVPYVWNDNQIASAAYVGDMGL